jgi:hypothetical protein
MPEGRLWELIEQSKRRKLSDQERQELQRILLRIAAQDLEFLADQEPDQQAEGETREGK